MLGYKICENLPYSVDTPSKRGKKDAIELQWVYYSSTVSSIVSFHFQTDIM